MRYSGRYSTFFIPLAIFKSASRATLTIKCLLPKELVSINPLLSNLFLGSGVYYKNLGGISKYECDLF